MFNGLVVSHYFFNMKKVDKIGAGAKWYSLCVEQINLHLIQFKLQQYKQSNDSIIYDFVDNLYYFRIRAFCIEMINRLKY